MLRKYNAPATTTAAIQGQTALVRSSPMPEIVPAVARGREDRPVNGIHSNSQRRYSESMTTPPRELRRSSIRLPRPLWIGLAAVVLIVGGVGVRFGVPIWRQQAAIREIERVGGSIETDQQGPEWPREYIGDAWEKLFYSTWRVDLNYTDATNATLDQLTCLTRLESLWLDHTQVTDSGLAHLNGFKNLVGLWLGETQVTDAGLQHLARLPDLTVLVLNHTEVSDKGLEHLKGSTKLRILELRGTRVTDAGVSSLKRELPRLEVRR